MESIIYSTKNVSNAKNSLNARERTRKESYVSCLSKERNSLPLGIETMGKTTLEKILPTTICPVCGKGFILYPEWAYRIGTEKNKAVCSWHCLREETKKHEKPPKKDADLSTKLRNLYAVYEDGEMIKTGLRACEAAEIVGASPKTMRKYAVHNTLIRGKYRLKIVGQTENR